MFPKYEKKKTLEEALNYFNINNIEIVEGANKNMLYFYNKNDLLLAMYLKDKQTMYFY